MIKYLLFFLLIANFKAYAVDEYSKSLMQKGLSDLYTNTEAAEQSFKKLEVYALSRFDFNTFGQAVFYQAINDEDYFSFGADKEKLYRKAIDIFKFLDDKEWLSYTYLNFAGVLREVGEYIKSLEYLQLTRRIAEERKDYNLLFSVYNNLSLTYQAASNYNQAIIMANRYEKLIKEVQSDNREALAEAFHNKAEAYSGMGLLDSALYYHKKIFTLSLSEYILGEYLAKKGDVFAKKQMYDEAIKTIKQSLEINRKHNRDREMVKNYSKLGLYYALADSIDKSTIFWDSSYVLLSQIGDINLLTEYKKQKVEHYKNIGDAELAIEYSDAYYMIKDSLKNEKSALFIENLEEKYLEEKQINKRLQNELFTSKEQLAESQKNHRLYLTGALIILIFTIGLFVASFYKKEKKTFKIKALKEKAEEKNKHLSVRLKLSRELLEYVKSKLNGINAFTEKLKKEKPDLYQQIIPITSVYQDSVQSIRHKDWFINDKSLTALEFVDCIRDLKNSTEQFTGFKVNFREIIADKDKKLEPMTAIQMLSVFQEFISNSVKHSGGNKIDISVEQLTDSKINIQLSDNGIGFHPEKISAGHGLRDIESRLRQIKANWNWSSIQQYKGATLHINLHNVFIES
ncbi:MAG: hypothetical protein EA412_02050 [Chitinophagaceae bacterium]|nr:MAG: hypothetical protein EA412_02050 [Chitinophagaceae bacterium]